MGKNFFSKFKKSFKAAERGLEKIAREEIDFALKPFHNVPIVKEITGERVVEAVKETVLLPGKIIQKAIDNPKTVKFVADVVGESLEVIGAITLQPEVALAGAIIKGGGDLIGGPGVQKVREGIKGKDIGAVITGLGTVGGQIAGLALLEEKENRKLSKISNTLTNVGKVVTDVDRVLGITNKLLREEIRADKTHNQQIKEFIKENHGENEALKHGQVVLDEELKKIELQEEKQEDILNQIKTDIDEPITNFDFVKDIDNFIEPRAIIEYLAENLLQLENLDKEKFNLILDLALRKGVLQNN